MSALPATTLHIETPRETSLADALALWRHDARHGEWNSGRYRCHYFSWGEGPPLIFIHGLCDCARSFVPMMALLRHRFRCIGYELPDGGSDCARLGRYRHDDLVDDLFDLLDHWELPRAYVFGSSFGSTIALAAMHARPERIVRSVLQGGFAWRPITGWERILCLFLRYGRGMMGKLPLRRQLHPWPEHAAFVEHARPEMWNFLMSNSDSVSKAAAARRGLLLTRLDLRSRLPEIRHPVLLVSGANDSIVPKLCDQALLDGLPNVDRVEIPECGHYPQYTHAALTAEMTRQFLTAPECVELHCSPAHAGRD
jgi:pimeloyl-ACP methyl ester carboxylesterase